MSEKPNCYKCKHRRNLPGDAHSCCIHPTTGHDGSMFNFKAFTNRSAAVTSMGIGAHPHGVRSGWFMWPINFDPVWLESCKGFDAKEEKQQKEGE